MSPRVSLVVSAFALAACAALAGCDSCKKGGDDTTPAPSASASASASAAPSASAAGAADAGASGKMAHCPNAVTGAATQITDSADGVVLTVTTPNAADVAEIRARAKFLADASKSQAGEQKQHNGSGEGGGVYGRCPVVMRNTTVDVADADNGATITVKPKDPKELEFLRREARDRQAELTEPGGSPQQGAGQGKMSHCPSAVDKSKTTVKDTKDGVEVTILAADPKDDPTVKDIRDRGNRLLTASKDDGGGDAHRGDGSGGGGFGRCPVVLKDTIVAMKEAPGGVVFTVKPKAPAGLADLKKEAHDRAANFATPH